MSRHRAPQRHPWPADDSLARRPERPRALRAQAVQLAQRVQGPLPGPLLPWLALLGYCGNNIVRAVQTGNADFVYATGLLTLIVLAAVLNLWTALTDQWETR